MASSFYALHGMATLTMAGFNDEGYEAGMPLSPAITINATF